MQSQVAEGGVRSLSTMKGLVEKRTLVQSPSFRRDPLTFRNAKHQPISGVVRIKDVSIQSSNASGLRPQDLQCPLCAASGATSSPSPGDYEFRESLLGGLDL